MTRHTNTEPVIPCRWKGVSGLLFLCGLSLLGGCSALLTEQPLPVDQPALKEIPEVLQGMFVHFQGDGGSSQLNLGDAVPEFIIADGKRLVMFSGSNEARFQVAITGGEKVPRSRELIVKPAGKDWYVLNMAMLVDSPERRTGYVQAFVNVLDDDTLLMLFPYLYGMYNSTYLADILGISGMRLVEVKYRDPGNPYGDEQQNGFLLRAPDGGLSQLVEKIKDVGEQVARDAVRAGISIQVGKGMISRETLRRLLEHVRRARNDTFVALNPELANAINAAVQKYLSDEEIAHLLEEAMAPVPEEVSLANPLEYREKKNAVTGGIVLRVAVYVRLK